MACCMSPEEIEQKKCSQQIEKQLKEFKKRLNKEFNILLLGTGESGKSTFVKQMRILHGEGYSVKDRKEYIVTVVRNLYMSIQKIILAMDDLQIQYDSDANKELADKLMMVEQGTVTSLEESYMKAIQTLWSDSGIQECYNRRREYQLIDSAWHYLSNIHRIGQKDYVPTIEDILRSRTQTTGIQWYNFNLNGIPIRMIDVGGQRSERKKWLHCLDNVKMVIFLVAISEYDQTLLECKGVSRMKESQYIFKQTVTSIWFTNSAFVLFLNKKDLLEEKIMYSNLKDYYPEYNGPMHNADAAKVFIRGLYVDKDVQSPIYSHCTCATDTNNIEMVFSAVKEQIFRAMLIDLNVT